MVLFSDSNVILMWSDSPLVLRNLELSELIELHLPEYIGFLNLLCTCLDIEAMSPTDRIKIFVLLIYDNFCLY